MSYLKIAVPEIGQNVVNYLDALKGTGLEPIVISKQSRQLEDPSQNEYLDIKDFRAEEYDGLLLPGGVDINPARYGETMDGTLAFHNDLDDLQWNVLDQFVPAGKPVLGICRGLQLINVYFGGSLIQNLDTSFRHAWKKERFLKDNPPENSESEKKQSENRRSENRQAENKHSKSQEVRNKKAGASAPMNPRKVSVYDNTHRSQAEENSWIARLYGTSYRTNSAHHQAVKQIGKDLVIDARCPDDGVVEALHHRTLPIIAVQFHPERMSFALRRSDTAYGEPVFAYFREMCLLSRLHNDSGRSQDPAFMYQI